MAEIFDDLLKVKDFSQASDDLVTMFKKRLHTCCYLFLSKSVIDPVDIPDLNQEIFEKLLNHTLAIPAVHSRVYEVGWMLKIYRAWLSKKRSSFYKLYSELLAESSHLYVPIKNNFFFRGVCLYNLDGIDESQYFFLKSHFNIQGGGVITDMSNNSRAICPYVSKNFIVHEDGVSPENIDAKWCILASSDSLYAIKFLKNYVNSVEAYKNFVDFHFHWVYEKDSTSNIEVESIISYASSVLGDSFHFSKEECPPFGDKRSYYACSRLLFAREFIKSYPKLIITDMDFWIKNNRLEDFISKINSFDITLQINDGNLKGCFPWWRVEAGVITMKLSQSSSFFLEEFSLRFKDTYEPRYANWTIDQNIIGAIYERLMAHNIIGNSNLMGGIPFDVPIELKQELSKELLQR